MFKMSAFGLNIVHFGLYILFFILRTAYCVFYIVFLLYSRPTAHFYMHICRILLIQLLGCHIEINACLVLSVLSCQFKHKFASVLAIGQLYHLPGCTTQLRDILGLPVPVRTSSKPVSCTFLNNFFYSFSFLVLIKIPNLSPSTVAF